MRRSTLEHETKRRDRLRVVRRPAARAAHHKAAAVKHLGNPITELYDEVLNTKATWVDAAFWFAMGILGNAFGEMAWDALKNWLVGRGWM